MTEDTTPGCRNGWRHYRRYWLPELLVLIALAVLITPVFWLSDLDIRVAGMFYHPDNPQDPWPEEHASLWQFCYQTAPLLAALLGIVSLSVLAMSHFAASLARYRSHALFVLLVVIIGPGLLVNGTFKEHWDRARPRQIQAFGEAQVYTPPLKIGHHDAGKAFPAGHSSVAFSLIVLWFLLRRHNRWLAGAALAATLVIGGIYGTGRMAAGAHFLSDVIWSALIPAGVALLLYYFVLNIPGREDSGITWQPRYPKLLGLAYAALSATLLIGVLVLTPFKYNWTDVHDPPLARLTIVVDEATVALRLVEKSEYAARVKGKARGFGLPGNRLIIDDDTTGSSATYSVMHKGVFTEIDSRVSVRVNPRLVEHLHLQVHRGNVRVNPANLENELELTIDAPDGEVTWRR